jgi:hypothetical protein
MTKEENWSYIIREGMVLIHDEIMSVKKTNSCLNGIITVGIDWDRTAEPDIKDAGEGETILEGILYLNNGKCYNWFSFLLATAVMSSSDIYSTVKHRLGYLDVKNCNNHGALLCRKDNPCKGTT